MSSAKYTGGVKPSQGEMNPEGRSMAKSIFISNVLPAEAIGIIPGDVAVDYHSAQTGLSKAELIARRALGFNMRVLYQDALRADVAVERELRATRMDLEPLLAEADFVSLHTPLLPETRHLMNERTLRLMKKSAVLVNAARGPVVDEGALVRALKEGWIAGAGLDVFEEEPKVHPGLAPLKNVVLAPHIASASFDTRVAMATLAVRNCLAVLDGKPPLTPVP